MNTKDFNHYTNFYLLGQRSCGRPTCFRLATAPFPITSSTMRQTGDGPVAGGSSSSSHSQPTCSRLTTAPSPAAPPPPATPSPPSKGYIVPDQDPSTKN
ncbi:hypothetical protein PGT21_027335 [Puccinia graminis f. sp. tritici]|uniref:Uncharacterized protein n=1 Tax=Puccinia graminis f. sp. tritici TaxID=56615 RepID=A0A5B0NZA0_PUCGR|nr:hypothetical protein PGT21_027335 [Puccinia graminis f. sp. tritici]